jgi:hypothetical protein
MTRNLTSEIFVFVYKFCLPHRKLGMHRFNLKSIAVLPPPCGEKYLGNAIISNAFLHYLVSALIENKFRQKNIQSVSLLFALMPVNKHRCHLCQLGTPLTPG